VVKRPVRTSPMDSLCGCGTLHEHCRHSRRICPGVLSTIVLNGLDRSFRWNGCVRHPGWPCRVWRSKPTLELGRHPAYIALMIASICIIGFGLYAGLDWTSAGSINVAAENSVVRNLAIGASLGTVALFGFGSYRAGRIARSRRRATAAVSSDDAMSGPDSAGRRVPTDDEVATRLATLVTSYRVAMATLSSTNDRWMALLG
jgi:hypothetical protein